MYPYQYVMNGLVIILTFNEYNGTNNKNKDSIYLDFYELSYLKANALLECNYKWFILEERPSELIIDEK